MLPEEVLKEAADEMLDYRGTGMSVMEMSHRSKPSRRYSGSRGRSQRADGYSGQLQGFIFAGRSISAVCDDSDESDEEPGGRLHCDRSVGKKAADEAEKYGTVNRIASSADKTFSYIPDCSDLPVSEDADYVYICENNTIYGTKFKELPNTKGKTLVADVSSCFLSVACRCHKIWSDLWRRTENIGPAGVVIVIIREDLITEDVLPGTPTMLKYKRMQMRILSTTLRLHTGIYICGKVFKWLKKMGGFLR